MKHNGNQVNLIVSRLGVRTKVPTECTAQIHLNIKPVRNQIFADQTIGQGDWVPGVGPTRRKISDNPSWARAGDNTRAQWLPGCTDSDGYGGPDQ